MFAKHLHFAWRRQWHYLRYACIIHVLAAILGFVLMKLPYAASFAIGLLIFGLNLAALPTATFVIAIVDYYQQLHGARAYLTYTLPAPNHSFYDAYLLLDSLISAAAIAIVIAEGLLCATLFADIWTPIKFFAAAQPSFFWWSLVLITLSWIGNLVSGFIILFFSISLGSNKFWQRLSFGGPVVIFIILSIVFQVIGSLSSLLLPFNYVFRLVTDHGVLTNNSHFQIAPLITTLYESNYESNVVRPEVYITFPIPILGVLISIVCSIVLLVWTRRHLDTQINLR